MIKKRLLFLLYSSQNCNLEKRTSFIKYIITYGLYFMSYQLCYFMNEGSFYVYLFFHLSGCFTWKLWFSDFGQNPFHLAHLHCHWYFSFVQSVPAPYENKAVTNIEHHCTSGFMLHFYAGCYFDCHRTYERSNAAFPSLWSGRIFLSILANAGFAHWSLDFIFWNCIVPFYARCRPWHFISGVECIPDFSLYDNPWLCISCTDHSLSMVAFCQWKHPP